jgi:hypothetical protein
MVFSTSFLNVVCLWLHLEIFIFSRDRQFEPRSLSNEQTCRGIRVCVCIN